MEKYSVLMSLYIKEKPEYLKLAIQSMVDQTYKPDEIVIVKDGKITPELQQVLDSFASQYPDLFNIVGYEENRGLGLALNYGLEHCKNELVARMDTDDISVLNRCEKQLAFFQSNPNTTILGGQIDVFIACPEEVIGKRIVPETYSNLKEFMKKRCPFNHMTVMFKKSDVINVGNYQDWFWNEDYFLWIRLALKGFVFANLPETLVHARVGVEMYRRRGGIKYFESEARLQRYMRENKAISFPRYCVNIIERFIIQVLIPNRLRGVLFKLLARKN